MSVLPDYLAPGLRVVLCGTAAGNLSAAAGHYFAGPGNESWSLLYMSGVIPVLLIPEADHQVIQYGVGLTDLAKKRSASRDSDLSREDFDVSALALKMARYQPAWLAFHNKRAAEEASRALGSGRRVSYGPQMWSVGGVRVFVLPSGSAANRSPAHLEGKASRLAWYEALASELPEWPDHQALTSVSSAQGG